MILRSETIEREPSGNFRELSQFSIVFESRVYTNRREFADENDLFEQRTSYLFDYENLSLVVRRSRTHTGIGVFGQFCHGSYRRDCKFLSVNFFPTFSYKLFTITVNNKYEVNGTPSTKKIPNRGGNERYNRSRVATWPVFLAF